MNKPVDVEQTDDRNLANWLHALPDSAITNGNAVEYWRAGFRFNKALTLVEEQAAEIKRLTDALEDCAALASFIDNADNVFSRCLFKVQKIAKAALKQGSNSDE